MGIGNSCAVGSGTHASRGRRQPSGFSGDATHRIQDHGSRSGYSDGRDARESWWQSSIGMFTPGTLAIVADAALGGAVMTTLPPGVALTTSQLAMSFLRTPSVESGAITARGRLVHETHTLGLCEALVEDADGRLLAHATTRCVLLQVEPHRRGSSTRSIGSAAASGPDPYERPVETTVEGRAVWNRSPGIERLRDLKRRVHPTPFLQLTGTRVADVMEGEVTVGMEASDWLANYGGTLYGGATTLLAEGACTAAVLSTLPAGTACAPLDISVNFLRAYPPFRRRGHGKGEGHTQGANLRDRQLRSHSRGQDRGHLERVRSPTTRTSVGRTPRRRQRGCPRFR